MDEKENQKEVVEETTEKKQTEDTESKAVSENSNEEKSLEKEVQEEQDRKYLAKTIVSLDEKISKMESLLNELMKNFNSSDELTNSRNGKSDIPDDWIEIPGLK